MKTILDILIRNVIRTLLVDYERWSDKQGMKYDDMLHETKVNDYLDRLEGE